MRHFDDIYALACLHKGGETEVEALLPQACSADNLIQASDGSYLSAMSRRIFRAGLKHSMVDAKWPNFEGVFYGFEPFACAMMSDEFIEACMADTSIIRHLGKVKTIRHNAQYILEVAEQCGNFGRYLAEWPIENTVELWFELKKRGAHLGGSSSGAFLRFVGRDTFMMTSDVISVLVHEGVVDKAPSSKRDLLSVQAAFNQWRVQSKRPLCEISRIVSMVAM